MPVDNTFDPFATRGLIDLPELDFDTATTWTGFQLEALPHNALLRLDEVEHTKLTQLQPRLLKLDIADLPLLDIEDTTDSSAFTSDDDLEARPERKDVETEYDEDIWTAPDLQIPRQENKLVSWDHFVNTTHREPACRFLSETGPAVYDLLLRKIHPKQYGEQTRYVRPDIIVGALFELGLGRDSVMFTWDEQAQRFKASIDNYDLSGCSRDVLQRVVDQYLDAGAQVRRLRSFRQPQSEQSPIRIALQTATGCVLDAFQDMVENVRNDTKTLVRLQDTFAKPFALLDLFDQIAKEVRRVSNDYHLVSMILAFVEQFVPQASQFEHVVHAVVSRMLQPVLEQIAFETGLSSNSEGSTKLESHIISEILPVASVELFHQTKSTLRILNEHNYSLQPFEGRRHLDRMLKISFSAEDVVISQHEAKDYEEALSKSVSRLGVPNQKGSGDNIRSGGIDKFASNNEPFYFDTDVFTDIFSEHSRPEYTATVLGTTADPSLKDMVMSVLTSDVNISVETIPSCRLAIDLSITPFLRAQHRLLSFCVLQFLFRDYNFVAQMQILGRFPLMGDGFFASKLSTALFDSDQYSGEGSRRTNSKTGLRLQNRETWPPASSELRLALMGILSESTSDIKDTKLVDAISFTIRDLSDENLERCRDLDSIHALDFLGLTFKPANTIAEAVVTTESLEQYDQIFNHLLRLLRMKAVVQSMLRNKKSRNAKLLAKDNGHRFRIQAQQFVSTFADYCTNIVIKTAWLGLEKRLHTVNGRLEADDYVGTLDLVSGLDHLRDTHENMLDNIMRGLMLKRRQSEAKGIIDRLFEVILRFAAIEMKAGSTLIAKNDGLMIDDAATNATKSRLHKDFQVHMKTLIQWLKGESGRAGDEGTAMFESLLLGLDWNGFWSR